MLFLDFIYYAFIVVVVFQFFLFFFVFGRFAFVKTKKTTSKNIPVSVIICAKNEAKNLQKFLPSIINQDYSDFEIVLINDASEDETLDVMECFSKEHQNIKIVNVKNTEAFWGNKKYALTLGIKAAKNDYLLFTDADCKPKTEYWIHDMSSNFTENKSIILGYGAYSKMKNSFLNKLIRFETLLTAVQYFSFAKIGIPYMGVGRNLAYTKDTFFNANGFIKHIKTRSGDDDLFINQVATKSNTAICCTKKSITESIPETSFKNWIRQKRRHVSTAKFYKLKHKIFLSLIYIMRLLFWTLSIILFATSYNLHIILALFIFNLTVQYIAYGFASKKLKETDLLILLPILDVSLIIMQLIIFINNIFSKPNYWK